MNTYKYEYEVAADFDCVAAKLGGGVGYPSIIGSGENSTYLHWTKNNGKIKNHILIDAGVQTKNKYTSDITRSFPVNGTFTKAYKMIYEAVLNTNIKCIAATNNGVLWSDIHKVAAQNISQYLSEWKIIKLPAKEIYKQQLYKRYMVHGIGHPLGLDVHDNNALTKNDNKEFVVKNGYIMTVEPGLYSRADDTYVNKEFRGIGIRIEDNILINNNKAVVLSTNIRKSVSAVEKWFLQ